ncbi:ER transporter 6TM N-terminal domain-containing protein [Pleurotus pulmonarius]
MFSLPPWLLLALKSRRKWKTFIRCTLVLVATLVLLVDDATLQSMGQAGFFAAILAIMLPPSMPLTLFILANMTLVIGMLLGWACGAAAMAAALKARSQTLLSAQLQSAQASLDPNMPAAMQFQRLMFNGHFLDTRSSVVYGVFIFVGSFFLAAIRGLSPSLSLLSIFSLIVLDVMCSYGPLFYSAQYTIAKQFLIPTGFYLAIAIAALVLVFPETLNHVWLSLLSDSVFAPIKEILGLLSQALSNRPSDRATWESFTHTGTNLRQVVTKGAQGLIGQTALLDIEFSLGKLGPSDLKKVSGEVKSLMFQTNGLLSFLTFVQEGNKMDEKEEDELERPVSRKDKQDGTVTPDRLTWLRRQIREHETRHGHSLDSLVPILETVSVGLRSACDDVLRGLIAWFDVCNSRRWRSLFYDLIGRGQTAEDVQRRHNELVALLSKLEQEIKMFQEGRAKLIEPYKQFFDVETGKLKETTGHLPITEKFTSRSLFLCFVFCDTLLVFSDRLSRVMRLVVDLDQKRPKVRLWAPSGFGKIGRMFMKSKGDNVKGVVPLAMGSAADPSEYVDSENSTMRDEDDDVIEEAPQSKHEEVHKSVDDHRRNPDALPPRTAMGRSAVRLGSFFRWFKSAEGVFALRTALVTLALWIPAVVPSSAGFNYEHKGLWALIMAQMSLAVYAGEQIAGIALRTVGTALGLLLGMAVWYIGAGSGLGNPYGVVISTTVFVAPFLYIRVVGPMQDAMLWILAGVTIIFVVGYSWIDSHLEMLTSSGVGVEIGWRRALLVIIGFVAAFVVMLFPQPTSARTLVRKTVASSLEQLGRVFASEVDAILAEEAKGRKGIVERPNIGVPEGVEVSPKEKRVRILAERMLTIATRLQTLTPSLDTGKWEPQLQGSWPQHHYQALHTLETRLLSCLGLLAGSFVRLDTNWCYILVHKTPFLNPHLLADIFSTISVLSHALSAGYPVPASLPRLRDRLIYHDRHMFAHGQSSFLSPQKYSEKKGLPDNGYSSTTGLDPSANKVDGVTIGFEELTLDVLMDDQLPAHSTAVLAISSMLAIIDEVADIIRILCGETSFEGIGILHQEYLDREEAMLYHPRRS